MVIHSNLLKQNKDNLSDILKMLSRYGTENYRVRLKNAAVHLSHLSALSLHHLVKSSSFCFAFCFGHMTSCCCFERVIVFFWFFHSPGREKKKKKHRFHITSFSAVLVNIKKGNLLCVIDPLLSCPPFTSPLFVCPV